MLAKLARMLMERRARAGLGRLRTASGASLRSNTSGFFLQVVALSGKEFSLDEIGTLGGTGMKSECYGRLGLDAN